MCTQSRTQSALLIIRMQPHLLCVHALALLAVTSPAGIEARGKKRIRNKLRATATTTNVHSSTDLGDASQVQVLHAEPLLEYRPQFLSITECQELLRLTDIAGSQWNQGAIAGTLFYHVVALEAIYHGARCVGMAAGELTLTGAALPITRA